MFLEEKAYISPFSTNYSTVLNKMSGYSNGIWQINSKIHVEEIMYKLLGTVAHAYNPSTQRRLNQEDCHKFKASLNDIVRPCLKKQV